MLDYRLGVPVLTVLVLLRREANAPSLTGTYERFLPDGRPTNRYNYQVARVWQEPPESFLDGGVGLLPLAPLSDVREADLPDVVRRMAERINREPRPRADKLWMATYLLMGLRYTDEFARQLLEGVQTMRESTTYQAIIREGMELGREEGLEQGREQGREEGRLAEARRMLLRLGRVKGLPEPDPVTVQAIEALADLERLEALFDRGIVADVHVWEDLLRTS
jgi:predicted transposase YdaD